MGSAELPWLVKTIDWMCIATAVWIVPALLTYVCERISFGSSGRQLRIDPSRRTMAWSPESFGQETAVDFKRVKSVRVLSNRDDWLRLGRTFSVVVDFVGYGRDSNQKVIQRSYFRAPIVALCARMNELVAPDSIPSLQPATKKHLPFPLESAFPLPVSTEPTPLQTPEPHVENRQTMPNQLDFTDNLNGEALTQGSGEAISQENYLKYRKAAASTTAVMALYSGS